LRETNQDPWVALVFVCGHTPSNSRFPSLPPGMRSFFVPYIFWRKHKNVSLSVRLGGRIFDMTFHFSFHVLTMDFAVVAIHAPSGAFAKGGVDLRHTSKHLYIWTSYRVV
jgi:hypothetical protein